MANDRLQTQLWNAAEHLESEEDMVAYLDAALEDGDPEVIVAALGDIRRAAHVDLAGLATKRSVVFYLMPDSPLRADMVEILDRHRKGGTKLYSHSEVWNE